MHRKLFFVVASSLFFMAPAQATVNQYEDTFPLILSSANSGQTWSPQLHAETPPPHRKLGTFSDFVSISCDQIVCVTVGSYTNVSGGHFPLLAVSFDHGNTWEYRATDTQLLPPHATFGREARAYFTKVDCTNFSCVAIGVYRNQKNGIFPMALVSFDHGNTWNYQLDDTTPQLNGAENENAQTRLNSVSCHEQTCIAVGRYINNTLDGEFNVIIGSVDGGKTWTYRAGDNFLPRDFDPEKIELSFDDVSCSEDLCATVGSYRNKYKRTSPMLAMSIDHGYSWEYRVDRTFLPATASTDINNGGFFRRIDCDKTLCAATGSFITQSGDSMHMILVSSQNNNGDIEWNYRLDDSLPPPNTGRGFFPPSLSGVTCKANKCVAVGSYYNTDDANLGMIIVSEDFGQTWNYQLSDSTPPPHSQSGRLARTYLTSVSCSSESCNAVGAYDNETRGMFPLVARTEDSGRSWMYPVYDTFRTPSAPTNRLSYTFLSDVHCQDRYCVAVGGYYKQK